MKYICLGYIEPGKFEGMTKDERHATFDDCFEYNDHLRANGHLVAEVPLQPPETALTLYWKNGKVATTDGPYAETKEQLGGIQILEARDLDHAVQLVSQQPGFKYGLGPIEIRPIADLKEIAVEVPIGVPDHPISPLRDTCVWHAEETVQHGLLARLIHLEYDSTPGIPKTDTVTAGGGGSVKVPLGVLDHSRFGGGSIRAIGRGAETVQDGLFARRLV